MKTIAVTGGKGGTGKSTVAILLAFSEVTKGKKVLLVDCDVECPNDYILLGINDLHNPAEKTYSFYPKFLPDKCTKCGLCVRSCKSSALFQPSQSVPKLSEDLCSSCGVCWTICPNNAIKKKRKLNGEIFKNRIAKNLTLVTGRSIPGVRETSPVVEQVREFVREVKEDFDLVIIDTAAGTHCTVMSALDGADKAYAVTEPTPLGAHDLNIILKVLKVLKIPSEVVLNRSDIGDKCLIDEIADDNEVKITREIPYNKKLAKSYSKGNFLKNKSELIKLLK
jgi:MinD superfamily P-loop ATPase